MLDFGVNDVVKLLVMTIMIMLLIFVVKKATKNINIPAVRAVVDEV